MNDEFDRKRKDRIYLVDFPEGYEHQCFGIIDTCEKFYMFGENRNTPSYEGADLVFIEPCRRRRHNLIIEFIKFISKSLTHNKRISVYTKDILLKNRIETELVAFKNSFSFFKVFYIKSTKKDTTSFYDEPYGTNQAEPDKILWSNVKSDLSGKWDGKWERCSGTIEHRGIMSITQEQNTVNASLTVTFEYCFDKTILKEKLIGTIIELSDYSVLFLNGTYYLYEEKGSSQSYLPDNFLLYLDRDHNTLWGYLFSKRGRGYARFNKV